MFSDPVSFTGDTRVEVITVLANCGRDTDRARRALVTWIRRKQEKGRSTDHILTKLRDIESKFIKDASLHSAFRDARAETFLPRIPDLPLPSQIRRQSPEFIPFFITPNSAEHDLFEFSANPAQQTTPPSTPSRFSRGSSQMSEFSPGKLDSNPWTSLYQGVSPPQYRSPRIQIPRNQPLQPGPNSPNSPIASSPEESEIQHRLRYVSHPARPSTRRNGLVTPVSASFPDFSLSPTSRNQICRRSPNGLVSLPPSSRIPIPRSLSQRSVPVLSPTSSSDESDLNPRGCRPLSQPTGSMAPSLRRLTPPSTSSPDVPLPPIPSGDQDMDEDEDELEGSAYAREPLTPMRSLVLDSPTSPRPLPIQPVPSPVPESDDSESIGPIDEHLLRQNWRESIGELPSDIVVRQDSPIYFFRDENGSIGRRTPHMDPLDSYFPAEMTTIGNSLDRALDECGGSPEVRLVVSKCVGFHRGYEPPYWQTLLQACGLGADAAKRLVDEMCKQVDWAVSCRRIT